MRSLAVFASSAAGACVLALTLLYAVTFVAAGPAPNPTTVEVQGVRGGAPPTNVPSSVPTGALNGVPTRASVVVSTPTDVPTPEPPPALPAPDDEGSVA